MHWAGVGSQQDVETRERMPWLATMSLMIQAINNHIERIHMKNKSDNNTYAVITRESIFVEAPCETTYFKNLLDAERFMASYLARPRGVEQCQLVKVMQ